MNYNLLTEETKKKNSIEYRLKELTVIFYLLSGILISGTILLLPSFFLVETKKSAAEEIINNTKQEEGKNDRGQFADTIKKIDESLKLIKVDSNISNSPSVLIQKIIGSKNDNVTINRFIYTLEGASSTVIIDGFAGNRDSFLNFVDSVKKTESFVSADYPVDLIARNRDIKFSITVK